MSEHHETHYDNLEGHWGGWVRIEGHLIEIPPEKKAECDVKIRRAIASLETDRGIPDTTRLLHAKLRG